MYRYFVSRTVVLGCIRANAVRRSPFRHARAREGTAKCECFKERVIYIRDPSAHDGDFMCLSGNGRYEAINFKNPDYIPSGRRVRRRAAARRRAPLCCET